jgi:hypothetical protein
MTIFDKNMVQKYNIKPELISSKRIAKTLNKGNLMKSLSS